MNNEDEYSLGCLQPLTVAGFLGDGTKVGVEVIYVVLVTVNILSTETHSAGGWTVYGNDWTK